MDKEGNNNNQHIVSLSKNPKEGQYIGLRGAQ